MLIVVYLQAMMTAGVVGKNDYYMRMIKISLVECGHNNY